MKEVANKFLFATANKRLHSAVYKFRLGRTGQVWTNLNISPRSVCLKLARRLEHTPWITEKLQKNTEQITVS